MDAQSYRGVVKGGNVLLEDSASLPDGTEVIVVPTTIKRSGRAALLAAIHGEPHLSAEEIEELQEIIVRGRRPLSRVDLFREDTGGGELA